MAGDGTWAQLGADCPKDRRLRVPRTAFHSVLQKHFLDIPALPAHPVEAARSVFKLERRAAMRAVATNGLTAPSGDEKWGEGRRMSAKTLIKQGPGTLLAAPKSNIVTGFGRVFLANSVIFFGKIWKNLGRSRLLRHEAPCHAAISRRHLHLTGRREPLHRQHSVILVVPRSLSNRKQGI
jgi:hypothetical protein